MTSKRSWLEAVAAYKKPQVLQMLFLGFAAGLPLLLVFGTLSAWLRREGIDRSTIGFVSWVALAYAFKVLWSPLVDRLKLPVITKQLGKRRSWMLFAQAGVITGLLLMSMGDPQSSLAFVVYAAIVVAVSSATQDIALDAWRIEAIDTEYQGAMSGTYQLGYRLGMLVAGGGFLSVSNFYGYNNAYALMAALMLIGPIMVLFIREPLHPENHHSPLSWNINHILQWLNHAIIEPFVEFFDRFKWQALAILAFIATFRISDVVLGVMALPLYVDMGYSDLDIGLITKTVGPLITIAGALVGGVMVMRYGVLPVLLIGEIIVVGTNLSFVWFSQQAPELFYLAIVVTGDNLAGGLAGSAFIAYLSSLTNLNYTATQYALFSSLMLLPAKFIGGFSGVLVDNLGYPEFFTIAAALGIPAVLLILWLMKTQHDSD